MRYAAISRTHHYVPITVETSGAFGHNARGIDTEQLYIFVLFVSYIVTVFSLYFNSLVF